MIVDSIIMIVDSIIICRQMIVNSIIRSSVDKWLLTVLLGHL